MPSRQLGECGGISRVAEPSQVPEERFDPWWGHHPREPEESGSRVAQAEGGPVGQAQRHPRQQDHGGSVEEGPSLPFVDEERLVPHEISVAGNGCPGGERERPHRERAAGPLGVDENRQFATHGRAQLQDLAARRLGCGRQRITTSYLLSQLPFWHGQHFTSEISLSTPAIPTSA